MNEAAGAGAGGLKLPPGMKPVAFGFSFMGADASTGWGATGAGGSENRV